MLSVRSTGAFRVLTLLAIAVCGTRQPAVAVVPVEGLSKAELHAKLQAEGGVAGSCTPSYQCCDYCWDGDCPDEWRLDNDCDCGCQWEDPRCPSCDYCWAQGGCHPDYDGDAAGCDCGCEFFDTDCPALVECTSDANCNPDDACFDHYCNTDINQCQSTPVTTCGDGNCDSECENCENCADDCGCDFCSICDAGTCASACGNGVCDPICEDCGSCAEDCACSDCESCQPLILASSECRSDCGNGVCDPTCEDCSTCPVDCGCAATSCQIITCEPGGAGSDAHGCTSAQDPICGACCYENIDFQTAGPTSEIFCALFEESQCLQRGGVYFGGGTNCADRNCNSDQRLDAVKKGSLLVFPAVELGWRETVVAGGGGAPVLTQDTILTLVNDFTKDVHVKLYFVNGDAPTEPIYADDLQQILLERGHNGWNQVDCTIELTENESTYLVMSSGVGGCQRFTILDPGTPPGRPSGEAGGGRVLRGFVIAFAVDENQNEISHNHLSGHADIINYELRSAWEYQAYSFQAINTSTGSWTDGQPGELSLDGVEYDYSFNTLLFDFYAVGSTAFSNDDIAVMLDTDLTLMPMDIDLRQDSCGPVTTKAHFDIWNANEDFRSGTTRCITCWDQTLLSAYSLNNGLDNNFILADLGTDKGKARIDGMASFECDNLFVPPDLDDAILQWLLLHDRTCDPSASSGDGEVAGRVNGECCEYTINDSQYSSLLGVAAKILNFSGAATGTTWAGMNLVGAGQESAQIRFDVPAPPDTAVSDDSRATKNASERNTLSPARGEK